MNNVLLRYLAEDDHDDDHAGEGGEEKKLKTIKIIVLFAMIIAGCFVFLPYSSLVQEDSKDKKQKCCKGKTFSFLNCFAAGMLMSMALCHILPEADAMYAKYLVEREAAEKAAAPELGHEDDHDEKEGGDHAEEEGEDHAEEEGEDHDDHDDHGEEHGFPFSYTFFLLGFLIMLGLDKVVFAKAEIQVGENKTITKQKIQEQMVI